MPFKKVIVIDAKDHILGRLASVVAKELLQGQKIVVTRCEDLIVAGSLLRNKNIFLRYLNKRCNTNPKRGPLHFRSPSRMFHRACRGMIPHKIAKGSAALSRLRVYEGVPPEYNKTKRMVVPAALRITKHAPTRKHTSLGNLAKEVGWKYFDTVEAFEIKRKQNGQIYYQNKMEKLEKEKASKVVNEKVAKELEKYGY